MKNGIAINSDWKNCESSSFEKEGVYVSTCQILDVCWILKNIGHVGRWIIRFSIQRRGQV